MTRASKSAEQAVLTPEQEAEQARILRENDGHNAYLFARDTPGADVDALQKVVFTWGSVWNVYWFTRAVPGASAQALQEMILTQGSTFDAYLFVREVPEANNILAFARRIAFLDPQDKRGFLGSLQKAHPAILTPKVLAELSLGVTL